MISQVFRSRDVIVFFKGDTITVTPDSTLIGSGWRGGQGVRWVQGARDRFTVGTANGRYGGFLLWGSDESSDQFTALTRNQLTYSNAVLGFGGWLMSTLTYEQYTYASRQGPGPLVPLSYNIKNMPLYFSLRGYWTPEDELTLSGSVEAPAMVCGYMAAPPKASNQFYLGVQTAL